MLSQKQLKSLRQKLNSERERLVQSVRRLDGQFQARESGDDGADDAITYQTNGGINAQLISLRKLLASVDHALGKFALGTYGICENTRCSGEIDHERLSAAPAAVYCRNCAGCHNHED